MLVGGVGVANAVKSHIDRRRDVIAAFKALGATGRDVFAIYLTQVTVLAVIGSVIGLAIGAALPFIIVGLFGKLLPLPVVPALHPDELLLSFIYGLLTALAFGLWPLGRVHDVPVAALFRETVTGEGQRPRWRYLALMAVVIALLIAVAIGLAYDKRVAAVFVVSSIVVFAVLRGVAAAVMALARRLPRSGITMLRLAIANIYRPGALTPSVVMSLGLGLAVLVTITQIDGNLRRQFMAALPDRAPSFYFIDIPTNDADRFGEFLKQTAPQSTVEDVPMLRGRIVAARGVKAEDLNASSRFRMGAAERPRPDLYRRDSQGIEDRRGQVVGRRLQRPAAGLDREEDRRRARAQTRRPHRRQRTGPRHHRHHRQHAHRRLAKPRHQFRAGVLAQRLQGRAAHPYRDPDRDPSGCLRATPGSSNRWRMPFRW